MPTAPRHSTSPKGCLRACTIMAFRAAWATVVVPAGAICAGAASMGFDSRHGYWPLLVGATPVLVALVIAWGVETVFAGDLGPKRLPVTVTWTTRLRFVACAALVAAALSIGVSAGNLAHIGVIALVAGATAATLALGGLLQRMPVEFEGPARVLEFGVNLLFHFA